MKVVVHGNCQSGAIRYLIKELAPFTSVYALEVHKCETDEAAEAEFASRLREADIVPYQPVSDKYRNAPFLGTSFVTATARPGATMVCYPSIYYHGYLQGYCQPDKNGGVLGYRSSNPPVAMVEGILAGDDDVSILEHLNSETLIPEAGIRAYHQACVEELRRREKEAEVLVPVSDYIDANRFERKVFHTVNHPYRCLIANMMNTILKEIGVPVTIAEEGPDPLAFTRVPCVPAVGKSFAETEKERIFFADSAGISRDEFFQASLSILRQYETAKLDRMYAANKKLWVSMTTAAG